MGASQRAGVRRFITRAFPARGFGAWLAVCAWFCLPSVGLAAEESEFRVKAAFIYKFVDYVQWPVDHDSPSEEFVFAVVGDEPLANALNELLNHRPLPGRATRVQVASSIKEVGSAQILFIGGASSSELSRLPEAGFGSAVLLISDSPGALRNGSMINFVLVDHRVRFEIARRTAEQAGLRLSGQLLSAAQKVVRDRPL